MCPVTKDFVVGTILSSQDQVLKVKIRDDFISAVEENEEGELIGD